ncbi:MAG: M16 family metallopeptidase [Thermoguttaceae bacterium]
MSESIFSHQFSNGLTLLAEPRMSLQSAAFTFLTPAGCAYDPQTLNGLSGFTCEMALRGSGSRNSRQFILDLDNLGVERSEGVSTAHTSYSGATLAENLPAALSIFGDMLRRAHLPEDQLEAGRLGMLQELQAVEDEPAHKVMRELRRRHYPLPWGRPPQGEQNALQNISLDDIRYHYRRYYRPNGTILGVAGRVHWDALKNLVAELFGDWLPREAPEVEEHFEPRSYLHLPYVSNQTQIGIAYSSVPYCHPDYFQAWGAVGVLSGGMSARLFTEIRERRGLCYCINAAYHTLRHRGGVFCYAGTSANRAQETLDVTLGELKRISKGVDDDELNRLKARIKSALVMQQESSAARSASIAFDWHHFGRSRTLDEVELIIDNLTRAGINDYLANHPPSDFTVVTLGPRKLEVPHGVL